jgi:hypothetical protein
MFLIKHTSKRLVFAAQSLDNHIAYQKVPIVAKLSSII